MRTSLRGSMLACTVAAGLVSAAPARADLSMPPAKTVVPVVLWGVTGAVIGAIALPVVFPSLAGGAAAAPGAGPAMAWTWGSFVTTRAIVGTVIGGAIGYAIAPP